MTRPFVPLLAAGIAVATIAWSGATAAQQPAVAPEPKMPPMPSMEGQQGDVSKPVTQIPPRKKPTAVEKRSPAKDAPAAAAGKKGASKARLAKSRTKR